MDRVVFGNYGCTVSKGHKLDLELTLGQSL